VDRIAKALTYNIFGYDTMNIAFVKMPKHLEIIGDIELLAFIIKNQYIEHSYHIYLSSKVTTINLKRVLSHEFVHLKQMEDNQLIQFTPDKLIVIWEGDTIDLTTVIYENRPHEINAHKQDDKIYSQLNNVLYK